MPIEAILFDLGKVLVDFDMSVSVETMMRHCSLTRRELEHFLWETEWIRRYECGQVSTREFHRYLRDAAKLDMDFEDFLVTWSAVFAPTLGVSEQLLTALRREYPLVLVSNTNEAHTEYIQSHYRVFDYFDHKILSFQVGALKPDRRIFERAIEVTGKAPDALFYTDDWEENVLAARELGIHAYRFDSEPGLIGALRQAGVELG